MLRITVATVRISQIPIVPRDMTAGIRTFYFLSETVNVFCGIKGCQYFSPSPKYHNVCFYLTSFKSV